MPRGRAGPPDRRGGVAPTSDRRGGIAPTPDRRRDQGKTSRPASTPPPQARGAVHLRNRDYEALRTQLQVATDAVESLLAAHYDTFTNSVDSVQRMATQYQTLKSLSAEARALVADSREKLSLPRATAEPDGVSEPPAPENRVLEHWEQQVEAEEALRLIAELRKRVR